MRISINIEMNDDTCTLESLKDLGYTKESIIDTYNKGLTLILQKFGDEPTAKNIHVETRVHEDTILDVIEHRVKRSDYLRLTSAINIIKDMVAEPSGGKIINDVDYVDFTMTEPKQLCLDAVNLIRDCIIEFGIDINDMKEIE